MKSKKKVSARNLTGLYCAILISVIFGIFIYSNNVFAGRAADGGDGTGSFPNCVNLCTDYGATWQWYDYNYTSNGVSYDGSSDTVTVYGYGGSYSRGYYGPNPGYAKTTSISGCKKYGGYWRYAMVAYAGGYYMDHGSGGHKEFSKGDQVGTIAIGGGDEGVSFRSKKLGGYMAYLGSPSGKTWNEVQDIYNNIFGQNWDKNSTVAMFCGSVDGKYFLTADAYEDDAYLYPDGFPDDHTYPLLESSARKSSGVTVGNNATISMEGKDYTGYSWEQWGGGGLCKGKPRNNCTLTLNNDYTANAYYVRNRFNGSASVSGGDQSANTGWVGKAGNDSYGWAATQTITMSGCPSTGCETQFGFDIQRAAGTGDTMYNLWREENDGGEIQQTSNPYGPDNMPTKTEYIKPGDKVCWRMSFYAIAAVSVPSWKDNEIGRVKVCAEAEQTPELEGKIEVSGSTSGSIGYTKNSSSDTYIINNCPATGCQINFGHFLNGSSGSTNYGIQRNSNLTTIVENYEASGLTYNTSSANNIFSDSLTMYPGMKICESLNFLPDITKQDQATLEACVIALGEATSSISLKAKNENGSNTYRNWQNTEVYAKPTDKIDLEGKYTPYYQYAYDLVADSVKIGNSETISNSSYDTLSNIFDSQTSHGWKNGFSINILDNGIKNDLINFPKTYIRANGITAIDTRTLTGNKAYMVTTKDVGKTALEARAETNALESTQTTPNKVNFTHSQNQIDATIDTSSISDKVNIYVPYNFENSTSVTSNPVVSVPAGESVTISFDYSIKPRSNTDTTNSTDIKYATSVGAAKWKLKYCIGASECNRRDYAHETPEVSKGTDDTRFNISVSEIYQGKTGDNSISLDQTLPVPDVAAGTQICVKSSIYPANSGATTNYSDPSGSGTWVDSDSAECFTVSKKPSFQVWGGSLYSADKIATSLAPKTIKNANGDDVFRVFNSWAELSLSSSEKTNALAIASGAGSGEPNGATSTDLCDYSTLTFANTGCNALIGSMSSIAPTSIDIAGFKSMLGISNTQKVSDLDLSGETVTETRFYENLDNDNKDITISGNIIIDRDATYSTFSGIPKVIVYASGNINIECRDRVSRIDAILIAEGTINTCSNTNENNLKTTSVGSFQLIINGALSADKIEFNRTYGAATGARSITPAEIINYDSSLILERSFGTTESAPATLDDLTVQYNNEIAPRY